MNFDRLDEIDARWPFRPDCTRDRLLHLLEVFSGQPDSLVLTRRIDEVAKVEVPTVMIPATPLTLGDLRILADVAIGREYELNGETGSEQEVPAHDR